MWQTGMRAYKVKTNIEVNRQKGDEGVKNHGANNFMAWKNPIQGVSYTASPSEAKRSEEENKLQNTRETVLSSDAPELVIFLQESDYQSIKDIFIDKEVPSQSRLNYKDIHSNFDTDVDGESKEPGKSLRIMSSICNEIEQGFKNYARQKRTLENLMKDGEEDGGRDDRLRDKSTGKMIPWKRQPKEFHIGDSISLTSMEPSATESIGYNSRLSEVSSNSEAASGSTIHLSDSSLATMSSLEETLEGSECHQPHKTESLSRTEDRMSQSLTGPSQSFVNELVSGPIPCSGSISLRSTSSSASSNSFAFPILPSEWNGSPVRMAEADPRHSKKHQNWRTCFLCCKF